MALNANRACKELSVENKKSKPMDVRSASSGAKSVDVAHGANAVPLKQLTKWVYDRGERPVTRGWFHLVAAWLSVVSGSVLVTYAFMTRPWQHGLAVLVYALGVVGLFGVSAAYHRGPWKSLQTITWWRRADHSMIAVFIASTYTPLCVIALSGHWWMLAAAWVGAMCAVVLNMVFIEHPRWLDVVVYLGLGWLIVPLIPTLYQVAGPAIVWLLFAGGVTYSLGALLYGLQWPGKNAKILGFHEVFHLATIAAAVVHLVAIWMLVVTV